MQILNQHTSSLPVSRVTTERKGAWRFQNAFRISNYWPRLTADGKRYVWESVWRGPKIAKTRATAGYWQAYGTGSLHNRPARHVTDDFGNMVFIA